MCPATAVNVVTMLGLGLAIDYSLFIVTRFREELAANLEMYAQRWNTRCLPPGAPSFSPA